MARSSLVLIIVVLGCGTPGCRPADPLDATVSAGSTPALALWRSRTAGVSAAQWKEFDVAIQELKYRIMTDGEVTGSEAVNRALMGRIDDRSLKDVMVEGWRFRLERLRTERDQQGGIISRTDRFHTRPGDHESADYLESRRRQQTERMTRILDEIEQARSVLERLGVPDGPGGNAVSSGSPRPSG